MTTYYKPGAWSVICDVCGFRFKSDEVRKRWDGLIVCTDDWETDHPQKFLRIREDGQTVPFVRADPGVDNFRNICWIFTANAFADLGTSDCMRADIVTPSYAMLVALRDAGTTN